MNLKPVHKIQDLKKDDLVVALCPSEPGTRRHQVLLRIGCVDGNTLFFEAPHKNIRYNYRNEPMKFDFNEFMLTRQLLKVVSDEEN